MKIKLRTSPNLGWIETQLDPEHIKFLWEIIKEGKEKEISHKDKLAGNISKSFKIIDKDHYFFKKVLFYHVDQYFKSLGKHPIREHSIGRRNIILKDMWVNYQYQNEFNPFHHHGGVYSFAIWLKIPYDWREQQKLPFLDGMNDDDKKAGLFEFEYQDILGGINHYAYRLDSSMEGRMLFFPSGLKHGVYPFYGTDEPRISVSGNLWVTSDDGLEEESSESNGRTFIYGPS